jgi:NADPH:quinone reductase-like Zn-dependent oxidoreductase
LLYAENRKPAVHSAVNELLKGAAEKRFQVIIDRVFPLSGVSKAHEYAETATPLGRIVMMPST